MDDVLSKALEGAAQGQGEGDARAAAEAITRAGVAAAENPPQGKPAAPPAARAQGPAPKPAGPVSPRGPGRPKGAISSPPSAPEELRRMKKPELIAELERARGKLAALEGMQGTPDVAQARATLTAAALLGGTLAGATVHPAWRVEEREAQEWAGTCAPVLAPYIAEAGPWAPWLTVASATLALLMPKYLAWSAARAVQEANAEAANRPTAGGGASVDVRPDVGQAPPAPGADA